MPKPQLQPAERSRITSFVSALEKLCAEYDIDLYADDGNRSIAIELRGHGYRNGWPIDAWITGIDAGGVYNVIDPKRGIKFEDFAEWQPPPAGRTKDADTI